MWKSSCHSLVVVVFGLLALHVPFALAKSNGRHLQSQLYRRTQGVMDEIDYDMGNWAALVDAEPYPRGVSGKHSKKCGKGKGETSCAPTMSPMPSSSPSLSLAPSSQPSARPSRSPSASPSKYPTRSPSLSPSALPTNTVMPSSQPTASPTGRYTEVNGENGLVTACRSGPPEDSGVKREERLVFRYHMYLVPDADPNEQAAIMEQNIHQGMSETLLSCEYDLGETIYVTSFSLDPPDSISGDACNVTAESAPAQESTCYVVMAETSCTVFITNSSRRFLQTTDASPEIMTATGSYLNASMGGGKFVSDEIVQVSFQGFVNREDDSSGAGSGSRGDVAGASSSVVSSASRSPLALGSVILGLAVLILLLVFTFTTRRRKQQPKAYIKHLDDFSLREMDPDMSHESLGDEGKVRWLKDGGQGGTWPSSPSSILDMSGEISTRHSCKSPTCPACRNRNATNPKFIHSSHLGYSPKEMRRMRDVYRIRESYRSPDTVEL